MTKLSSGILAFREKAEAVQVLLVHPGGPLFRKKDAGVWSIPKGEYNAGENPIEVAKREFNEETGNTIGSGELIPLNPIKTRHGKTISVWAVREDFDPPFISSNTFEMEWPPGSGRRQSFPETDQAAWMNLEEAKRKINQSQVPILEEFAELLKSL